MASPARKKFKVSHGNASLWVSPYKGGWRFRWREHPERPEEPLEEVYRTTKAKAEEAAIACMRKLPGVLDLTMLTPARRSYLDAVNRETMTGDEAAVLAFLAARRKSALLADAVKRFLAFKTPAGKDPTPHVGQMGRDLQALVDVFPKVMVTDIHLAELEKFLNDRTGRAGDARRKGIRGTLVQFWKWCQLDGIAGNDVKTVAQRLAVVEAPAGTLQILEVRELELLLSIVEEEFLPWIILGAFQGIRPEEIAPKKDSEKPGLRWEHIDWQWNTITVPKEVAKTRRKKSTKGRKTPLHAVTRAWLAAFGANPEWRGAISLRNPSEVYKDGERLTTRWGRALAAAFPEHFTEWPADALRHSFASYRIAVVQSAAQAALEMGTSEAMLHGHYNNPRTTPEGEAWFAFTPDTAGVLSEFIRLDRLPMHSPESKGENLSNPLKAFA